MFDRLVGSLFGEGGTDSRAAALDAVRNIPLPVLKEYYPELYKQVVQLEPELETAVNLGPSEMQGISTDPALRQAQLDALNHLQQIGSAGGRDAQFLSDASRMENDINTNLKGQSDAIMQNMAARGMSGGGNEFVQRQMAAQNAANRQAQMGMDLNAQAQQRALQAIMQSGNLGGQMQQQDFGQQAQKAQAADAIARFNAQNQQQVIHNNVGSQNQAQQWNASNAQNIAGQNTGVRNQAQLRNINLDQQRFDNEMAKATGVANQYNIIGGAQDADQGANRQFFGDMVNAGMSAWGSSKTDGKKDSSGKKDGSVG